MSSRERWKRQERMVASILNGTRLPCIGTGAPDVVSDLLAVEVKTRKSIPKWLSDAIEQSIRNAPDDKIPCVCLSIVSQGKKAQVYILMRIEDFERVRERGRSNHNSVRESS